LSSTALIVTLAYARHALKPQKNTQQSAPWCRYYWYIEVVGENFESSFFEKRNSVPFGQNFENSWCRY
jgi:hypothetical protein